MRVNRYCRYYHGIFLKITKLSVSILYLRYILNNNKILNSKTLKFIDRNSGRPNTYLGTLNISKVNKIYMHTTLLYCMNRKTENNAKMFKEHFHENSKFLEILLCWKPYRLGCSFIFFLQK